MTSKYKKYSSYKDSGVEWLGEIPSHWEIKKMKFLGSIYPGLSGKKGDDFSKEFKEDFKPFIPFTNICNNLKIDTNQYQYVHVAEFEVQNKVQKNDILFLMSSETLEDIGKCSLYDGVTKEIYLNSFCKGFRFNSNNLSTYFVNYLLQGQIYRNYFSLVGRGFTRINLKQEYINDAPIVLPSLQEQTAIANFLDNKTSKIDTAIAQKEQMIALLKERKQIVIQNAVTGKWSMVDGKWTETPKEKMKDSGVEWIGEIPEGWEVVSVKHTLEIPITDGPHTTPQLLEDGYPFISAEAIKDGKIDFSKKRGFISEKDHKIFCQKYKPKRGDIYMVKSGATTGNIAMVETDMEFSIWSPLAVFRTKEKVLSRFFLYNFLESYSFRKGVELKWSFGTQQNIGMGVLSDLPITFGNIKEQGQIVNYIKVQSTKIERAISLKQSQIEKLKEYKATLIDGAVTGKIRVSG